MCEVVGMYSNVLLCAGLDMCADFCAYSFPRVVKLKYTKLRYTFFYTT
jgi:hypothetical protein